MLAAAPDVVIVATGGLPQTPPLEAGDELVVSSWDILAGDVKPAEDVLLYDDNGAHPGMAAAEIIADARRRSSRSSRPSASSRPRWAASTTCPTCEPSRRTGVRITINHAGDARVRREGNQLVATLWIDYSRERLRASGVVDQVVVEHGTLPLDDLYFELKPLSTQPRRGRLRARWSPAGRRRFVTQPGRHASSCSGSATRSPRATSTPAIYDGLRLVKDL